MKLVLEAVVMELDHSGNAQPGFRECSEIVQRVNGTEIDGITIISEKNGNLVDVVMEGEGLSDGIRPNYPRIPLKPVMQIGFKIHEARFTASVLNRFMRRVNKMFPGRTIVIRDVKDFTE